MSYSPPIVLTQLDPSFWWITRLISLSAVIFLFLMVKKNCTLSLVGQICLLTTPWLFILAHEFNPYVSIFLVILALLIDNKIHPAGILSLILFPVLLFASNVHIATIIEKFTMLINYISFDPLFFQMESESFYLHVPKIGYFLFTSLPFLMIGIFANKWNKKIFIILVLGILFYFMYPTNHFIFAGAGILTALQLLILSGLYKLPQKSYITIIFVIGFIINFIFFIEMYQRHYEKLYSDERGYNEFEIYKYIIREKPDIVYLPSHSSLELIQKYYQKHYNLPKINFVVDSKFVDLRKVCLTEKTLCIVSEEVLYQLKLNNNDGRFKTIKNASDLTIYYIL